MKSFAYSNITLIFIIGILSLLLLQSFQISGDGLSYYAYLRSLVFDHNLDFTNEFTDYNPQHHATPDPALKTDVGKVGNPYAVGPAILWSPFVLIVHLAAHITTQDVTGYEQGYAAAIAFGTDFYVLLGLLALYDLLRRFFEVGPTLVAIAAVFWGTAAINYLYFEPAYAHLMSAAWVMIFVATYQRFRQSRHRHTLIYAACAAGFMILTRWQSALFLLLPLLDTLQKCRSKTPPYVWGGARGGVVPNALTVAPSQTARGFLGGVGGGVVSNAFTPLVWIGGVSAIIFLPQLIVWHHLYGQWLTVPMGSSFIQWQPEIWWKILVSPRNGLFSWTPMVLLSLLGLPFFYRRDRLLTISLTGVIVAQWLLNASIVDWWGGAAFGARRFIECSVIFALGLASGITALTRLRTIAYASVLLLVGWNVTLWTQYAIGSTPIKSMSSLRDIYKAQFSDGLPNLPRLLGRSTWLDWLIRSGLAHADFENIAKALVWLIMMALMTVIVLRYSSKYLSTTPS